MKTDKEIEEICKKLKPVIGDGPFNPIVPPKRTPPAIVLPINLHLSINVPIPSKL